MEKGQVFDGWTITEFIQKRGHSGIVARVRHEDGRKGIMKIYLPRPGFRVSRFRYEDLFAASTIIAGFKPLHYGRGFIEGRPYFVVEEVTPLPDTLPPDELKAVLLAAIRICYHLQLAGFYHADIKPDNMGRRADGSLVLFDFGCVLRIKKATRYPLAAGTDYYQSPEAQHGDVSDKSEIYSLSKSGIVLADAEGRIRFAHAFLAGTEKHPDERPRSYAALADLIENSESTFMDVVRLYSRIWNKVIIAASVVVCIVGIAVGYGWLKSSNDKCLREDVYRNMKPSLVTISLVETGFNQLWHEKFTNGYNCLEMATRMGDFEILKYRQDEVFRALAYCCERGIGTATNKVKAAEYRRKIRKDMPRNDGR